MKSVNVTFQVDEDVKNAADAPNAVTLAAMDAAENDTDMYGPFDSVGALMEALNA